MFCILKYFFVVFCFIFIYLMKSTKGRLATNMSIKTDIAIIKLANKTRLQLLKHKLYKLKFTNTFEKKLIKNTLYNGAKIELVRDCLKLLRLAKLVGSRGNLFHIPTILLEKKELRTDFLETTCINWYVCPRKFIPFLFTLTRKKASLLSAVKPNRIL